MDGAVWILAGVAIALGLVALTYLFRLRHIASLPGAFDCPMRKPGARRWTGGLARIDGDHLCWFAEASLLLRPRYRWPRAAVEILSASNSPSTRTGRTVTNVVIAARGREYEMVILLGAYTALRSWMEAAPPQPMSNLY